MKRPVKIFVAATWATLTLLHLGCPAESTNSGEIEVSNTSTEEAVEQPLEQPATPTDFQNDMALLSSEEPENPESEQARDVEQEARDAARDIAILSPPQSLPLDVIEARAYKGTRQEDLDIILLIGAGEAYAAPVGPSSEPELVFQGNEIYRSPKGTWDDPVVLVVDGGVYKWPRQQGDEPIATVVGNAVYRGWHEDSEEPIATFQGKGDIFGACAAVYLLLPRPR